MIHYYPWFDVFKHGCPSSGTTGTAMLASLAATGDKRSLTIQVAVSNTSLICNVQFGDYRDQA